MKIFLHGKEAMDYLVQELVERKLTNEEESVNVTIEEANFFDGFFEKNDEIWDDIQHDPSCIEFPEDAIEAEIESIKDNYDEETVNEDEAWYGAQHNLEEGLAYWTVYFKPNSTDVEAALHVGLIPFYYEGELYLALGGCGMDLSPR